MLNNNGLKTVLVTIQEIRYARSLYYYLGMKIENILFELKKNNTPATHKDIVLIMHPKTYTLLISRLGSNISNVEINNALYHTFNEVPIHIDPKTSQDYLTITNIPKEEGDLANGNL
jgi:hypothetical protein